LAQAEVEDVPLALNTGANSVISAGSLRTALKLNQVRQNVDRLIALGIDHGVFRVIVHTAQNIIIAVGIAGRFRCKLWPNRSFSRRPVYPDT
jgi:hypothetical protein